LRQYWVSQGGRGGGGVPRGLGRIPGRERDLPKQDDKGSTFHRVIDPGFLCQGGDITEGNVTGGESIYGDKFPKERSSRKHSRGALTMAHGVLMAKLCPYQAEWSQFNLSSVSGAPPASTTATSSLARSCGGWMTSTTLADWAPPAAIPGRR
jgi:hypothetical protein